MKLSKLIHYRNTLRKYTPGDVSTFIREQVGHALYMVQEHELQFPDLTQALNYNYHDIYQSFSDFSSTIGSIQSEIRDLIEKIEPIYFAESFNLYKNGFVGDSVEYTLDRRIELSPDVTDYLHSRIRAYGEWQHAGMIIRPGKEDWIHDIVACDPMYLVDQDLEFLGPVLGKFNEQYKNRLRKYIVKEAVDNAILHELPNEQFGFCLVYNFFNYKPYEIVNSYLTEIYQKLKPGGTLAFTFNNCDLEGAVELSERSFMCYTPGNLIFSLCDSIGYDMVQTYQLDAACTWVEIRKPGLLTSLRGGQSLAKIVAKSK